MWGALKKDFGEFVSTVAIDATDVLQQLDTGMDGNSDTEREAVSLIDPDTGIPIEYDDSIEEDEETEKDPSNADSSTANVNTLPPLPGNASIEEMKTFLTTCDDVFLDPLPLDDDPDVQTFMESFDLLNETDGIATLLDTYKDTLEPTFSRLIDQLEYADFWTRFFYRIESSENRLKDTYEKYYDKHVQNLEAAAAAATASSSNNNKKQLLAKAALSNVTNFLGSVVYRLVEENDVNDTADDDEEEFRDQNDSNSNLLSGGGGVRPPFGLKASVSDDADLAGQQDDDDDDDDEEEEEELGWDDDDDDEVEEENEEEDDDDRNETVEFKDLEKEKLQEDLLQAQEERDMLQKTVAMQVEELKKLKEATQPFLVGGDESTHLQALQMQLFEKDAELAALRAELDDMKNDGVNADVQLEAEASSAGAVTTSAKEVDRLKLIVANQQEEIKNLKRNKATSDKDVAEADSSPVADLIRELNQLQEVIAAKDREIVELRKPGNAGQSMEVNAFDGTAEMAQELDRLKEAMSIKEQQLSELEVSKQMEVRDLQSKLEQTESDKLVIESKLVAQLEDLRQSQQQELSKALSDVQGVVAQKDEEIASLKSSLEIAQSSTGDDSRLLEQLQTLHQDLEQTKAAAAQASQETSAAQTQLAQSQAMVARLQAELEQTKALMNERQVDEHVSAKLPSSPGSSSTGVKVSTDALSQDDSPVVSKPTATNMEAASGDDDGWGDDW